MSPTKPSVALAPSPVRAVPPEVGHHRPYEDVQAIVTGTLFVALGVVLLGQAGLLTGGTAGIAFLVHYATGLDFGLVFFVVNLPFYLLAWRGMGAEFTLKTFAAVALMALFAHLLPLGIKFESVSPVLSAVLGGLLCGAGMLMLFRHHASLGGVNVLVLYLQDRVGWRAGKVQMAIDGLIVLGALWVTDWRRVALSVLGAAALNMALAVNHRPGRYMAV